MFCRYCGKALSDDQGSKFCPFCGKSIDGSETPRQASSINISLPTSLSGNLTGRVIGILALMGFGAFGFFWKIMRIEYEALGELVGYYMDDDGSFSLYQLWKLIYKAYRALKKYAGSYYGAISKSDEMSQVVTALIIIAIPSVLFLLALLAAVFALYYLFLKNDTEEFLNKAKTSAALGLISSVIVILLTLFLKASLNAESEGMGSLISNSLIFWALLVGYVVNLVLCSQEQGQYYIQQKGSAMREKTCTVCKERFITGTRCPKCGSSSYDYTE